MKKEVRQIMPVITGLGDVVHAVASPVARIIDRVAGTDLVKGFSDFAFGFRAWGAAPKEDFDIFYDDIAIDTKRIGPIK